MADEDKDVEIEVKPDEKDVKPTDTDDKDKGKGGPPVGSERWNEIYWKSKEGERAISERDLLRTELASNKSLIQEMSKHNQMLTDAVNKIVGAADDKAAASNVDKIESRISELRAEKRAAREKADYASEDRIDEELADLRFKVREAKAKPVDDGKKPPKGNGAPSDKDKGDELSDGEKAIYDTWIDDNEWFIKSPKLRSAAINFEKEVRKDPDFEAATIDEILKEVKRKTEAKFKSLDTGGVDLVSGASSTSSGAGGTKVKLSPIELEIASGFGISPEGVARQKIIIEKAKSAKARR